MFTQISSRESRSKLGFVLSGGGARGPFQAGVYQRLLEDPRFEDGPAVLSGTSAGAMNSAMIAADLTPTEILDFWIGLADDPTIVVSPKLFESAMLTLTRILARELFTLPLRLIPDTRRFLYRARHYWPPSPGTVPAMILDFFLTSRFDLISELLEGIREPFLLETRGLRERLVKLFGSERIPARRRVAINAVEVNTGRVVRYVTGPVPVVPASEYVVVPAITVDMLVASASIPILFNAVSVGDHLLWDGGLLVNTPLAPAVSLGADRIVTVLVTEQHRGALALDTLGRAIERTADAFLENAYNVDRMLLLERNRLARQDGSPYREVTLYEAIHPAPDRTLFHAGSYLDFRGSVLRGMYRAGQRAASDWLAKGPPVDRLEKRRDLGPRATPAPAAASSDG